MFDIAEGDVQTVLDEIATAGPPKEPGAFYDDIEELPRPVRVKFPAFAREWHLSFARVAQQVLLRGKVGIETMFRKYILAVLLLWILLSLLLSFLAGIDFFLATTATFLFGSCFISFLEIFVTIVGKIRKATRENDN